MTDRAMSEAEQVYAALRQLAATTHRGDRLEVAMIAYEDARSDGLCFDGAWECAIAALGVPRSEGTERVDG